MELLPRLSATTISAQPPHYGLRRPRPTLLDAHHAYLRERVTTYPDLSARRLLRELRGFGYAGGYSQLTEFLRDIRPAASAGFERRFETPQGQQAQVDFAQFRTEFTDEPGAIRIVWLFSMVLGHSRMIWATFVMHQDLQAVLRCHVAAFEALGGVPAEILYDRMRTAVTGEGEEGIVYNATLQQRHTPGGPAHATAVRRRGRTTAARDLCRRGATSGRGSTDMSETPIAAAPATLDRVRHSLVGLKMPRALEALDHVVRQIERGETSALEAIDTLLAEELTLREGSRIKAALRMARLTTVKTLQSYDFSFQPSLDRNRILALAQLDFISRHEVLHLLGPPGTGKSSRVT